MLETKVLRLYHPNDKTTTYEYDLLGQKLKVNHPDAGEVVIYHYNAAGRVGGLLSNRLEKEYVIVNKVGYDKEGHSVYTKLGNGTETRYTYDKQRERLQNITLK